MDLRRARAPCPTSPSSHSFLEDSDFSFFHIVFFFFFWGGVGDLLGQFSERHDMRAQILRMSLDFALRREVMSAPLQLSDHP